jgi:hypothetical protein
MHTAQCVIHIGSSGVPIAQLPGHLLR